MIWEHFSPEADPALFKCQCGRVECVSPVTSYILLSRLVKMRKLYGRPLIVDSGPRCPYWNTKKGGKKDSDHLSGQGADLRCLTSRERYEMVIAALDAGFNRIGVGANFLHVGSSEVNAQDVMWTYYEGR